MSSIPHDTPQSQQKTQHWSGGNWRAVPRAWITPEIVGKLRCHELRVALAACEIVEFDGGELYASNEKIAEKVGMDKRDVRRALASLRKRGIIELVAPGGGRKRASFYRLKAPEDVPVVPGRIRRKGGNEDKGGGESPPGENPHKRGAKSAKNGVENAPPIERGKKEHQHAATAAGGGGEAEPPPAELVEALQNVDDLNQPVRVAAEAVAAGWETRSAVALIRKHTGGPGALRQKLRDPDEAERCRRREPRHESIDEMMRKAREIASPPAPDWGAGV